jgi:hypothetical protein
MIISIRFRTVFTWLIAMALAPAAMHAGLIHRYSFNETGTAITATKDSVGSVDGRLKGSASVADGKLTLKNDESSTSNSEKLSYVEFASSILPTNATSTSLVMWFMAKDTGPFARLLDIGEKEGAEGRAFIYFTPRTADDQSRAAITATDVAGRVPLDNARLDDGKPHMVAIVIDGNAKKMHVFIDGKEPKPAEDLGENTLDKVRPVGNLIGKSSFDNDPGLSATIDEFRVYDNALSPDDVTAINKAGPDALPAAAK